MYYVLCQLCYKYLSCSIFYIFICRSKLQDQEQLRAAGLDTATTTVYVVTFATALLIFFVYAHRLKDRLAHHRVKVSMYNNFIKTIRYYCININ